MRGSLALIYADLALVGLPYVLAQDAAVERTCTGELRHGAFCLAVATPPPAEVADCLHRFQLVGRGRELAVGLGGTPWQWEGKPSMPLHGRTRLPRTWFTGSVRWVRLLARRFRAAIPIDEGEMRAFVLWGRALATLKSAYRTETMALTDNSCVAGLVARGRVAKWALLVQQRRFWAVCAAAALKLHAPWIDTYHQPADGGTRLVRGRLELGPVTWKRRDTVLSAY